LIFSSVDSDQTDLELRVIDSSAPGDSAAPLVAHPDAHDLAKALRLELESIDAKADDGIVTIEDVKRAIQVEPAPDKEVGQPLHGSRKAMAEQLGVSAREPVVTTLAMDITLPSGRSDTAPILALLRAIADACLAYPALNAHYDSARNLRCLNPHINIGFTIDIDGGLVIPVLKKVEQQDPASLSLTLNTLQQQVQDGQLDPGIFHGASITLTIASVPDIKFASVPVMAPQVAGIGVGQPRQAVVIEQDTLVVAVVLPVTLSFDRRVVSSEEASRFLLTVAQTLSSEA